MVANRPQVVWNGTQQESLDLVNAIAANCTCEFLGDVLPRFSAHDPEHVVMPYAEQPPNAAQVSPLTGVQPPDLLHLTWRELRSVYGFSPLARNLRRTPFPRHVSRVISFRPKKQVLGVHTRGVVASVENTQPIRNRSIRKFPCYAVRAHHLGRRHRPCTELPVAVLIPRRNPQPATARPINFGPEPLAKRHHVVFDVTTPVRGAAGV